MGSKSAEAPAEGGALTFSWSRSSKRPANTLGPTVVVRHIELHSIDERQIRRIVQARCGHPMPDTVLQALGERSGGNPMFLLQLLQQLQEADAAAAGEPNGGRARASSSEERRMVESIATLPASIHDSVLSSLSSVSVGLQSLLKVASVFACPGLRPGRELRVDKAMLLGLQPGPVSDVTDLFRSRELERYLVVDPTADAPSLRFRSHVVCEVIYSLLLLSQRQQTHCLAAHWLERLQDVRPTEERAEAIAWHWLKSTTVQEDGFSRFSGFISLAYAKEPWVSPPPGVTPDVLDEMNGHDIIARFDLAAVMDLDSMPASMKLTDEGVAKPLDTADRLSELTEAVVQPGTRPVSLVLVTNQSESECCAASHTCMPIGARLEPHLSEPHPPSAVLPLMFIKTLASMRAIALKAVLVNLTPSLKRAIRTRQALDALGLHTGEPHHMREATERGGGRWADGRHFLPMFSHL